MTYMTNEIAKQNIGRLIDSDCHKWHYFPMQIIECKDGSGKLLLRDAVGVCQPIHDSGSLLNRVWFDSFVKEADHAE
jgi:hypothetical protein